jgi:hypothetical protein
MIRLIGIFIGSFIVGHLLGRELSGVIIKILEAKDKFGRQQ